MLQLREITLPLNLGVRSADLRRLKKQNNNEEE